jgi:hypothetical protein
MGEQRYKFTRSVSALDGVSSQLHPRRFIPREKVSGSHHIGGWESLRASLDAVEKKKIPAAVGNPTMVIQPVA